jgi:hypothetical protein
MKPYLEQVSFDAEAKTKGCEECEKMGSYWVHLRLCYPAVMLAVVILQLIGMEPNTSEQLVILSLSHMN